MPITINIVEIQSEDYQSMEEMCENIIGRLDIFREKHPNYSFVMEKDYNTNTVVIKNCLMNECSN